MGLQLHVCFASIRHCSFIKHKPTLWLDINAGSVKAAGVPGKWRMLRRPSFKSTPPMRRWEMR
eukprot:scaffold155669_cov17-Tisochrysis_lutea.AAC.1